jgi:hypothetical protein
MMKLPRLQNLKIEDLTFFELRLPGWCQDDGGSSLEGQDYARMMPPPRNFPRICQSRGRMMPGRPQKKTRDHTNWPQWFNEIRYIHIHKLGTYAFLQMTRHFDITTKKPYKTKNDDSWIISDGWWQEMLAEQDDDRMMAGWYGPMAGWYRPMAPWAGWRQDDAS